MSAGGGLYLLVNPSASRWWRFKFRVQGRENLLSLGVFPEVPLREARSRGETAYCKDNRRRDFQSHRTEVVR